MEVCEKHLDTIENVQACSTWEYSSDFALHWHEVEGLRNVKNKNKNDQNPKCLVRSVRQAPETL